MEAAEEIRRRGLRLKLIEVVRIGKEVIVRAWGHASPACAQSDPMRMCDCGVVRSDGTHPDEWCDIWLVEQIMTS